MRTLRLHEIDKMERFKSKLLHWAQRYNEVVWLDSNNYPQKFTSYDAILAVNAHTTLVSKENSAFNNFKSYYDKTKDWIFGYLTYDLKNDIEELKSENLDVLQFPALYFFQPKKLFLIKGNQLEIAYLGNSKREIDIDFEDIKSTEIPFAETSQQEIKIRLRTSKERYYNCVNFMLNRIQLGDIYEANLCQEFYSENTIIQPLEVYERLNQISKPPFATFLKQDDKFVLSGSIERYLKKEGRKIISQPIKGTAKRSETPMKDQNIKNQLTNDLKELSENIMIVDLVRNDLSKTAAKGSVDVEELCGTYTFEQAHQLVSTVTSRIKETAHPISVLETTFPMGSMTGAPKIKAMQIIEELEDAKRGLYSGSVGYLTPTGDFDFNVIIRSILYNATKRYVSYSVGSAITSKSNPDKEYEECLIKAKAMREVLTRPNK